MKTLAYSYQRFSNPSQAAGDSLRRQTADRDGFLKKNGLTLDRSLTFVDAGVSGFRGRNRDDRNDLGRFLALVNGGRVPRGSYLIVESLDRLSRQDIRPALTLLLNLIEAGVRVVQLRPAEAVYDEAVEPMSLMMAIMEMSRANAESVVKSQRLSQSWESRRSRARESGRPMTGLCPAWLRRTEAGFGAVADRAAVVKRMFQLAADGHGIPTLIRRLTEDGAICFARSGSWHNRYVYRILTDRRVLGELQPTKKDAPDGDPIAGYFPAVVGEKLFHAAQAGLRQRRWSRGRRAKGGVNLFKGLLRDAADGESYEWHSIGENRAKQQRARAVYFNSRNRGGQSPYRSFPVDSFEEGVLSALTEVTATDVLPRSTGLDEAAAMSAELESVDEQLRRVTDRLVAGGAVAALAAAAERLEARQRLLRGRLAEGRAAAAPAAESLGQAQSLIAAVRSAGDSEEVRLRLRAALLRAIDGIDCLFLRSGYRNLAVVQLRFSGGRATRLVAIRYRRPHSNGDSGQPPQFSWETLTAKELPAGTDLRDARFRRLWLPRFEAGLEPAAWARHFAAKAAAETRAVTEPTPRRRPRRR